MSTVVPGESPGAKGRGRLAKLRREAMQLTQSDLAERSGMNQVRISRFEKGLAELGTEELETLSSALDVPASFFEMPYPVTGPSAGIDMHYRKRAGVSQKMLKALRARMALLQRALSPLLEDVAVHQQLELRHMRVNEDGTPEKIAQELRYLWRLPEGPIDNVTQLLERAGILIIPNVISIDDVDAVSWDVPGEHPLIFTNRLSPGCRLRFSLGHELAHIIMHSDSQSPNKESEADRFSAEFLMPGKFMKRLLGVKSRLRLADLGSMKQETGYSMAFLARRARDVGAISEWHYKQLFIELSQRGYRRREPEWCAVEHERPSLIHRVVRAFMDGGGYNMDEVREVTGLPRSDIQASLLGASLTLM